MNLEVSKSHSRCVVSRQLIPKHQLTFSLYIYTAWPAPNKELNQGYVFTSTAASFHQSTLLNLMSSQIIGMFSTQHLIIKLGNKDYIVLLLCKMYDVLNLLTYQ